MSLSAIFVAVKSTFSSPFWRANLGDKNAHVKLKLSKNFSLGHPFAKMPKMSHFSGLGNGQLRCVCNIVSGAKPLSLTCLIRNFIPCNFP